VNEEKSAGFQLANLGYDVWFGNNRGNIYSRHNTKINPDSDKKDFFNYSFYTLGQYDVPAQIDNVRKITGYDKISYIGHSQGTSQMYVALAENYGNIQEKLNLFCAFAPIVNLSGTTNSLLKSAAKYEAKLESTAWILKLYEVRSPGTDHAMHTFCWWFGSICNGITSLLKIDGSPYNNNERSKVEEERPLSSASLHQVVHYGQIVASGDYVRYNYNSAQGNIDHYGYDTPPKIPLGNINSHSSEQVPIAMFVGQYDDLAVPADCEKTRDTVANTVHYQVYPDMDHSSFTVGKTMSFFKDAITLVEKYNTGSKTNKSDIAGEYLY